MQTQIDSNVQATLGRWVSRYTGEVRVARYFDATTVRLDVTYQHGRRREQYLTVEEWYELYDQMREGGFSKA